MVEFQHLNKNQQNFLNGKISQFIDTYIRLHKVWTPEQLLYDFLLEIENKINNGYYLPKNDNLEDETLIYLENRLKAFEWLLTENGKTFTLSRITKKYHKNKFIANKKSPIKDRVRFGIKKFKNKYFDINFGLKDSFRFYKTSNLEKINEKPWTIEHVNNQLSNKYNCNIKDCFKILSNSHLEKIFYEFWIKHYYKKDNPALIPEVCGFRNQFYYYFHNDNIYGEYSDIPENIRNYSLPVNFRYDFLIINYKKQKIAFIELDGFEFHKSRKQQSIDSIKRNNSSKNGVLLYTFTSKRILENLESVFNELDELLK